MTSSLIQKILHSIPAQLREEAQDMINGEVARYFITEAFSSVDQATDSEVQTARLVDVRRQEKVANPLLIGRSGSGEAGEQDRQVVSMGNEVETDDIDNAQPT